MELFTIGHSAHSIEKFIELLQIHNIQMVIDVRSVPASRWHPQYNKAALLKVLAENNIAYTFKGLQLGGRPNDPTCYDPEELKSPAGKHLRANFSEIMKRDWSLEGIKELLQVIPSVKTAILCSEENPQYCHRHELIAKYLLCNFHQIKIYHIRKNGRQINAQKLVEMNPQPLHKQ